VRAKWTVASFLQTGLSGRAFLRQTSYNLLEHLNLRPMVWNVGNAFKVHEFRQLVEPSGLDPSHVVLDLGCGTGLQTVLVAKRCSAIWGLDVSPSAIRLAQERALRCGVSHRATFLCSPLELANLQEESFDRVFSFCVLEHIPNLDQVLTEIYRLLKPGGEMHVTVDSLATIHDPEVVEKHRRDHLVVEYFTPQTLTDRLRRVGFEMMEVYPLFTSELAREAFEQRIINSRTVSMLAKLQLYRALRSENAKNAKEGIMVLARVRKPLGPTTATSPMKPAA
jgi:ubiquinone/menaquinone biosynthesis C-methylase UbiE